MKKKRHVVVLDDDQYEVALFRELYEGEAFKANGIVAGHPADAARQVVESLRDRQPDLFGIDLFWPVEGATHRTVSCGEAAGADR